MQTSTALPATASSPTTTPAKWAALVNDQLFPMPRRKLKTRDIAAQAGVPGTILIRDYNQPLDVVIPSDADVDLAQGNVFRILESCENPSTSPIPGAAAKLAYVADDAWEVTVIPNQTTESLRGLLGLPDDAELFRDLESPNDQRIEPGELIRFEDGPVFRTQIKTIVVKINNNDVRFQRRVVTALELKKTAIAQGIKIDEEFALYRIGNDGSLGPAIADQDNVVLKCGDEFRCLAAHDNS